MGREEDGFSFITHLVLPLLNLDTPPCISRTFCLAFLSVFLHIVTIRCTSIVQTNHCTNNHPRCRHLLRLGKNSLPSRASLGQRPGQTKLRPKAVDAVRGIEVLDHHHLVARRAALARRNGRPGEEELPDAVPALAKLGRDGVGVAEPVAVPPPQGARVVDADGVDAGGDVSCVLEKLGGLWPLTS